MPCLLLTNILRLKYFCFVLLLLFNEINQNVKKHDTISVNRFIQHNRFVADFLHTFQRRIINSKSKSNHFYKFVATNKTLKSRNGNPNGLG